jgi:hypothetical protein
LGLYAHAVAQNQIDAQGEYLSNLLNQGSLEALEPASKAMN